MIILILFHFFKPIGFSLSWLSQWSLSIGGQLHWTSMYAQRDAQMGLNGQINSTL